jgi:hypothetical protein
MSQQPNDCKHSKFKLCFKLKQHTPIIHFQHDQSGATLRATELKPKLDRFLIEHFTEKNIDYKKFLINGQDGAFDYKVKIEPNKNQQTIGDRALKNYFGNQGSSSKKYGKFNKNSFKLEIICFHSELLEVIKEHFATFFAIHNFGSRQSKGYGSFYLDETSEGYKDIEEVLDDNIWYIEVETDNKKVVDEVIKYFWQYLKSGINLNYGDGDCDKPYYAPFIREYLYSNNTPSTWDKRWLKETFFGLETNNINNYVFARALLGLSSVFIFKETCEPCNRHSTPLSIDRDYQIEVNHDFLDRIPSPIIFKPIVKNDQTKIYILLDQELLDEAIRIASKKDFDFKIKLWEGRRAYPDKDRDNPKKYFIHKDKYESNKVFFDTYWDLEDNNQHKIGVPKVFNLPVLRSLDLADFLNNFIDNISIPFDLQINNYNRISFSISRIQDAN